MHKSRINRAFAGFNNFITIKANVSHMIAELSENLTNVVNMRVSGHGEKIQNIDI